MNDPIVYSKKSFNCTFLSQIIFCFQSAIVSRFLWLFKVREICSLQPHMAIYSMKHTLNLDLDYTPIFHLHLFHRTLHTQIFISFLPLIHLFCTTFTHKNDTEIFFFFSLSLSFIYYILLPHRDGFYSAGRIPKAMRKKNNMTKRVSRN